MKKVADYVLDAKRELGDPHMSDRALGEHLGYSTSTISDARYGFASDHVALALARVLKKVDAGEIILVARAEREKKGPVRDALLAYAKKVVASVLGIAVNAVGATIVALGLFLPTHDARASVGGDGRLRP